eukprot:8667598-Alexandrium_andersonii.AAC.1
MAVGAAAWFATRGWGPEQENDHLRRQPVSIVRALQREPARASWHQCRLAGGDKHQLGFGLLPPFSPCLPAAAVRKLGP